MDYSYSGLTRLSVMKNGKPQHIDGGVPTDIPVTRDSMFDRVVAGTLIGAGFPV